MRTLDWKATAALLVASISPISADKDTDYYPGYINPNVEIEMYWKDAINVLQDLDQFSALYIKYHSCVWSEYGNEAVENGNGCSGDGSSAYWYMGRTQCFRANAAYSLYGILTDTESQKSYSHESSNCNEESYINSFFTNYGVEAFAAPLGIDTSQANSQCSLENSGNGQYHGDSHMAKKYAAYTSVTTGCSADGLFVLDQFQGAFCDGFQKIQTVDTLADFNDAISNENCIQIYGDNYSQENDSQENDSDERELEEENSEDAEEGSIVWQILSKSTACSIREYPHTCPDPFGLLKKYTVALEKASKKGTATHAERAMDTLPWFSLAFLVIAATMFYTAHHSHKIANLPKDIELEYPTKDPIPALRQHSNTSQHMASKLAEEPIGILRQFSNVSHSVASKVAMSVQSVKTNLQNYAEEEETVILHKDELEEERYEAPTPTSSSADDNSNGAINEEEVAATEKNKCATNDENPIVQGSTLPVARNTVATKVEEQCTQPPMENITFSKVRGSNMRSKRPPMQRDTDRKQPSALESVVSGEKFSIEIKRCDTPVYMERPGTTTAKSASSGKWQDAKRPAGTTTPALSTSEESVAKITSATMSAQYVNESNIERLDSTKSTQSDMTDDNNNNMVLPENDDARLDQEMDTQDSTMNDSGAQIYKRKKRPRMARISKKLFGTSKKTTSNGS